MIARRMMSVSKEAPAPSGNDLLNSLISYWALDEESGTRADSHGSNDLTDNNTVLFASGKQGNAADFEASNTEYLEVASNTSLQTGDIDYTIAGWVNFESLGARRFVASKWDDSTSATYEWFLDYDNTTGYLRYFIASSGGNTPVSASNFGTLSISTWYFFVIWHDATANTINIQVNNSTVNSAAHSTGSRTGTAPFQLGRLKNFAGSTMDGLIDEVGFWKRTLTSGERTDLYNSGNGRTYSYFEAA